MPIESKAQQRAMYAAKEGKSTLGIPQKVGSEFVAAGKAKAKLPERVSKKPTAEHAKQLTHALRGGK
jgi:hypothetical protein